MTRRAWGEGRGGCRAHGVLQGLGDVPPSMPAPPRSGSGSALRCAAPRNSLAACLIAVLAPFKCRPPAQPAPTTAPPSPRPAQPPAGRVGRQVQWQVQWQGARGHVRVWSQRHVRHVCTVRGCCCGVPGGGEGGPMQDAADRGCVWRPCCGAADLAGWLPACLPCRAAGMQTASPSSHCPIPPPSGRVLACVCVCVTCGSCTPQHPVLRTPHWPHSPGIPPTSRPRPAPPPRLQAPTPPLSTWAHPPPSSPFSPPSPLTWPSSVLSFSASAYEPLPDSPDSLACVVSCTRPRSTPRRHGNAQHSIAVRTRPGNVM